jgi:predicted TIM-barrel fold metal-dependent hydrolase
VIVDVHCHVGQRAKAHQPEGRFSFEPVDYAPHDAYLSDRLYGGFGMRVAKWWFGLPDAAPVAEVDAKIEATLLQHILSARLVDRVVLLAFDQYHQNDGVTLGPRVAGQPFGTELYVSNTYARSLCLEHPERLLLGASIHPYRPGAADMLAEVVRAGAVLIKWLPLAQNINAEDPRSIAFIRRAAEFNIPLLIHYGGEYALGNMHPELEDPAPLLRALDQLHRENVHPTVIVAHMATPGGWPWGEGRFFRIMCDALAGEFADAPLYADISALAMFNRARWLKRLARMPDLHRKLVYGSDFPIPVTPLWFLRQLGRGQVNACSARESWIDRDVVLKRGLGFDDGVFHRGGELLHGRIAAAAH